ncbi:MAG: HEAT repeat domain-containing protein, partial [Lentisphaerae bacterium]|nr:HEAT repeat domain-containing protein [Lentisphaerota bacterium]
MSLLTTTIKLFPLFLPIWQDGPFEGQTLNAGPYPIRVEAKLVEGLKEGWAHGDQHLRSAIAQQLGASRDKGAFDFLVKQVSRETDARMLATVLQQLAASSFTASSLTADLVPLLTHDHPPVRYWSAVLFGRLPMADLTQLGLRLRDEPRPMVREGLSAVLLERADGVGAEFFKAFWNDPNPVVAADARAAVALKPNAAGLLNELKGACTQGTVQARYALASRLQRMDNQVAPPLARILTKDTHASIRSAVARAVGGRGKPDLLGLLPALAADTDPDVRRQAAASLGKFPTGDSRGVLIRLIGDSRNLVRMQAEEGLLAIAGDIKVPQAVASKIADSNADVRYHACRVLGYLEAKEYTSQVFTRLAQEKRPRNIGAVVFALGRFRATAATDPIAALAPHTAP